MHGLPTTGPSANSRLAWTLASGCRTGRSGRAGIRSKPIIAPWAAALSQNAAKYAIIDFGQAAASWGDYRRRVKAGRRDGRRAGFHRFKRRRHEQGFRGDNGPDTVRVDGKAVVLPKIGRVAMVESLRFAGSIREVTVNRTAGTWFAAFAIEDGQTVPPLKPGPAIGVDVGVGTLAVCSDGTTVENPKALAAASRRLRRLDKAVARSRNVHDAAVSRTGGSGCMPSGATCTPGSSTCGMTIATRQRRR